MLYALFFVSLQPEISNAMEKNRNADNVRPFEIDSAEKAREMGRKGGIQSGKSKREKKRMCELLEAALQTVLRDKDGKPVKSPDTGRNLTRKEAGMIKLAAKAANGDLKSIELAAKLLGELTQQLDITADVKADVAMGFDPLEAVRELYGKEGGDE